MKAQQSIHRQRMPLPAGFRAQDFFGFHGRDQQAVAEKITGNALQKAIVLKERPALLTLTLNQADVEFKLEMDGPLLEKGALEISTPEISTPEMRAPEMGTPEIIALVQHVLGFTQPIAGFEQAYKEHPLLGEMIAHQAGLRVPVCFSPFEALTWAIIAQQVSLSAAFAIRRKFIQLANVRHSSGFYCYPAPGHVAALSAAALRQAGISQSKANTLLKVSELALEGHLPLDDWLHTHASAELIAATLTSIKGIGPWTASYTLLRGYGWLDGSLHGDVAVRRAIRMLTGVEEISEKEAELWLKAFSPWRALLAAHLWAWKSHLLANTVKDG